MVICIMGLTVGVSAQGAAPSIAPAPAVSGGAEGSATLDPPVPKALTDLFWGLEMTGSTLSNGVLNAPTTLTSAGTLSTAHSVNCSAVEFDNSGTFTTLYILTQSSEFGSYNTTTVTYTAIGNPVPFAGETFTAIATDPTTGTVYAASTSITASSLYTIDLITAVATRIGAITSMPAIIGIGIDNSGAIFGYGIETDALFSIHKTTGTATQIGTGLGFDANYAQGMDFDEDTNTCYLFATNQTSSQSELRTCNTATGTSTLMGVIGSVSPGTAIFRFIRIQPC